MSKKYRHKPSRVWATMFTNMAGTVDQRGFPFALTVIPTGKCATDGLYGPLPLFSIAWVDNSGFFRSEVISHNTVILARPCYNSNQYYLDFMDYDQFLREYEVIE